MAAEHAGEHLVHMAELVAEIERAVEVLRRQRGRDARVLAEELPEVQPLVREPRHRREELARILVVLPPMGPHDPAPGAARDSSTAHEHHRHPGAIGQRKTPGKVWKGKHLPGHYGTDNVTIQNLTIAGIEADKNLLLVTGAVPGHADGLLFVNTAVKGQPKPKQKQEERQRAKPKV